MVDYKNYKVWQKAHQLVVNTYGITKTFPKTEQFGLVEQINGAVVSIPTNIAEGCGLETQKELVRFLYISSGSAHELEYLVALSNELGFIKKDVSLELNLKVVEVKKMLASLINKIKQSL